MKFLAVLLSLAVMFNANAGLITTQSDQATYNAGDTILVDLFVNDANPVLDWLSVDFNFDSTQFLFNDFTVTDDVFLNSYYYGAYEVGTTFNVEVGFFSGWSDFLGTSFKLGQAEFTALEHTASPKFTIENVIALDVNYADVDPQVSAVSEPSTVALFSLMAGLVFMRKRKQA